MTKDKELKLALEALESADWYINQLEMIVYSVDDDGTHENRAKVQKAITTIQEALAQPEPIISLQCANCQLTIEQLNDKVMRLMAQPEQSAEPVELLKKADVFAMAVTHGIDANTKGLYGFYIDCMSTAPPKAEQDPFGYFKAEPFGWTDCSETDEGAKALYEAPPKREWVELTEREIELLNGMIKVQLDHAAQCDNIANRVMAEKQKGWDMERVELLRKLKEKST